MDYLLPHLNVLSVWSASGMTSEIEINKLGLSLTAGLKSPLSLQL